MIDHIIRENHDKFFQFMRYRQPYDLFDLDDRRRFVKRGIFKFRGEHEYPVFPKTLFYSNPDGSIVAYSALHECDFSLNYLYAPTDELKDIMAQIKYEEEVVEKTVDNVVFRIVETDRKIAERLAKRPMTKIERAERTRELMRKYKNGESVKVPPVLGFNEYQYNLWYRRLNYSPNKKQWKIEADKQASRRRQQIKSLEGCFDNWTIKNG